MRQIVVEVFFFFNQPIVSGSNFILLRCCGFGPPKLMNYDLPRTDKIDEEKKLMRVISSTDFQTPDVLIQLFEF